jgi:hypothetical protein
MLIGPAVVAGLAAAGPRLARAGALPDVVTGWWANLGFAVLLHLSWWMTLSRLGLEGSSARRSAMGGAGPPWDGARRPSVTLAVLLSG